MSAAMKILFAVLLVAALCYSEASALDLEAPAAHGSQMNFVAKRSYSGYMPWSKKWARLEPSIRFFKRAGVQPLMYEDDAFF